MFCSWFASSCIFDCSSFVSTDSEFGSVEIVIAVKPQPTNQPLLK